LYRLSFDSYFRLEDDIKVPFSRAEWKLYFEWITFRDIVNLFLKECVRDYAYLTKWTAESEEEMYNDWIMGGMLVYLLQWRKKWFHYILSKIFSLQGFSFRLMALSSC